MAWQPRITVSKTALNKFAECERRWVLQYERFKLPAAMVRDAKFQRRLMPSTALAGQIVDDVITYMLRHYHASQKWPQELERGARRLLEQYKAESAEWIRLYHEGLDPDAKDEDGEFLYKFRRQPLESVFFEGPLSEAQEVHVLDEVARCVRAWLDSGIPEHLMSFPLETWRVPPADTLAPSFEVDGFTIWAKYDFAIQTEPEVHIYDWKTGKLNEPALREQLFIYGLYAVHAWQVRPENLRLFGVWLSAGPEHCLQEVAFDVREAESMLGGWLERAQELRRRMKQVPFDGGPILFELFPMTGYPNRCRWCAFRCCEGYALAMGAAADSQEDGQ